MLTWLGRLLIALVVLIVLGGAYLYTPDVPKAELVARYGGPDSQFIALPGFGDAHYRDRGDPAAPVLMLLHGSNASLHTWEPWVKDLSGAYRVVTVDLPGHGLTGAVERGDYSQQAMADFVLAFADALKLTTFALGGNSMGGGVAARFAILHPERLTALILIDAGGMPSQRESDPGIGFRLARMPVLQNVIRYVSPRAIFEASLKTAIADDRQVTDAMVDRYWLLNRMDGTREASLKRFQLSFDDVVRTRAHEIRLPTLILWGAQDTLIPADAADAWHAAIAGSQLIVYPGIGHIAMEEAADKSAADVEAFLNKVVAK